MSHADLIARAKMYLGTLPPHAKERLGESLLIETVSALEKLTQPVGVEPVVVTDHPDLVGGIVWSPVELRWINERLARLQQERDAQQREWSKAYDIGIAAIQERDALQSDIATLEQESKQMRARMERQESELDAIKEQEPTCECPVGTRAADFHVPQCPAAPQPAPSVPDGWKLVPIEPTAEMRDAGIDVRGNRDSRDTYRAMIAASPQPTHSGQYGWPATHLKTGNQYVVTGERINTTNVPVQPGATMVDYERDGEKFCRESVEFQDKFKAAQEGGAK